jgi:hypothetical protein
MPTKFHRLLYAVRPFRGEDVRRIAAYFTLGVALPRLPLWPGAAPTVNPLRFLPPEVFGWITLILGIALLLTNGRQRHRFRARLVAFVGLLVWAFLAGATNSATSFIIDITVAYALLGEIGASRDDC